MAGSVVFGLDGLLANHKHRLHHIEKDPPDYRAFYGQDVVGDDGGYKSMIQLCQQLAVSNTVIILTERPIAVSEVTRRWLKWHNIPRLAVYTRQDCKYDDVSAYKIKMLKQFRREGFKPWLVIDCDPEVVRQARRAAGAQGLLV